MKISFTQPIFSTNTKSTSSKHPSVGCWRQQIDAARAGLRARSGPATDVGLPSHWQTPVRARIAMDPSEAARRSQIINDIKRAIDDDDPRQLQALLEDLPTRRGRIDFVIDKL
jgi:hypothetical protein